MNIALSKSWQILTFLFEVHRMFFSNFKAIYIFSLTLCYSQNSGLEVLCNLSQACKVIWKKTLTQMCSCEFCKIFKNTFYIEHLRRLLLYSGTVWKVFQYGVFPGPYFPVFSPNAGKYRPGKTSYSRIVGFSFRKYFHLREYKNSSYYAVY